MIFVLSNAKEKNHFSKYDFECEMKQGLISRTDLTFYLGLFIYFFFFNILNCQLGHSDNWQKYKKQTLKIQTTMPMNC